MALPEQDRAYLARQLIASLDDTVDADAEEQWNEVIDRLSRERVAPGVSTASAAPGWPARPAFGVSRCQAGEIWRI
jgi:hypothetical protein